MHQTISFTAASDIHAPSAPASTPSFATHARFTSLFLTAACVSSTVLSGVYTSPADAAPAERVTLIVARPKTESVWPRAASLSTRLRLAQADTNKPAAAP